MLEKINNITTILCFKWLFLGILMSVPCIIVYLYIEHPLDFFYEYGQFFFLGLVGAVAANSTGAGGGIVFIPAFTSLHIEGVNAVGTSIAIQCFGMTAGSLSWIISIYRHEHGGKDSIKLTNRLLVIAGLPAIAGMLCAQYFLPQPIIEVAVLFKYFSILFGVVLLVIVLQKKIRQHTVYTVRRRDIPFIVMVCFSGGMVTSWISIGAGEWLAILLFFLGYPTMVIVCVAVCISSMVVLAGVPFHIWIAESISWQILLFAAPAAIIGGSIARLFSERLGPVRLKIFFSVWILVTGLAM